VSHDDSDRLGMWYIDLLSLCVSLSLPLYDDEMWMSVPGFATRLQYHWMSLCESIGRKGR